MAIFITGVTGYIGGSVAAQLVNSGKNVRGLVRSEEKARQLTQMGITPVMGSLDDADILIAEAHTSEAVINAADSDHRGAVGALIKGLAGSGKPLLHTGGSGLFAEDSHGEYASNHIYNDAGSFTPDHSLGDRAGIDQLVRDAGQLGIRSGLNKIKTLPQSSAKNPAPFIVITCKTNKTAPVQNI